MAKKQAPVETDPVADAIAALKVMGTGASGTLNYIGLPAGANTATLDPKVAEKGNAAADKVARDETGRPLPRYYAGAENTPVFENWPPDLISQMQTKLVQAGLLDTDYSDGWWGPESQTAFSQVLGHANNAGTDYATALSVALNSAPMEIDPKTGLAVKRLPGHKKGSTVSLLNPNDIAATANSVAVKRLGRGFSAQEMQKFVDSYHAAERAGAPTVGGEVTAPMAVDTAAAQYAQQVDPVGAQARNILPLVDSVNQLMKGSDFTGAAQAMRSSGG